MMEHPCPLYIQKLSLLTEAVSKEEKKRRLRVIEGAA